MEPKKNTTIIKSWQLALQSNGFRIKISISIALLIVCAVVAPSIFKYIQKRDGIILNDYVLSQLPPLDFSIWIFTILYGLIAASIFFLIKNPHRFLIGVQAYTLLTLFRFITLLLTPLEAPLNMVELNDPFVQRFFYQQTITKDLFFSGHTSLLTLLTLIATGRKVYYVLLIGTLAMALMLLLQHAHYTIDILLAPVFAWLAFYITKRLNKQYSL